MLLLGDDEDDIPLGDQCLLQAKPSSPSNVDTDSVVGTCNALEFVGSLASIALSATMKLEGTLMSFSICLLVDSGASHNFISRRLVEALGLSSQKFSGIKIKLGDGHFVFVSERYVSLQVTIGPCSFTINALVFDTGSLDFILGLEWLKSLGEVVHDWQHSWMRFTYEDVSVQLHGLQTGSSAFTALEGTLVSSSDNQLSSAPPPLTTSQQSALSSLIQQFAEIFSSTYFSSPGLLSRSLHSIIHL